MAENLHNMYVHILQHLHDTLHPETEVAEHGAHAGRAIPSASSTKQPEMKLAKALESKKDEGYGNAAGTDAEDGYDDEDEKGPEHEAAESPEEEAAEDDDDEDYELSDKRDKMKKKQMKAAKKAAKKG